MTTMQMFSGGLSSSIALVLLLVLIISGKVYRDNWKLQGQGWKVKCWIAGGLAFFSFMMLAFIPLSGL